MTSPLVEPADTVHPADWLRDTGERLLATLIQSLLVFVPMLMGPWNVELGQAILAACFPAVMNVLLISLTRAPKPQNATLDLFVRMGRTFVVGAAGALLADGVDIFDGSVWRAAALGGLLAVAALAKGSYALAKPHTVTPASLARA